MATSCCFVETLEKKPQPQTKQKQKQKQQKNRNKSKNMQYSRERTLVRQFCERYMYNLIPVWMAVMVTPGLRVTGMLELVQSFCGKVAWSNWSFHEGWLCKGNDCKEVLLIWRIWTVWVSCSLVFLFGFGLISACLLFQPKKSDVLLVMTKIKASQATVSQSRQLVSSSYHHQLGWHHLFGFL